MHPDYVSFPIHNQGTPHLNQPNWQGARKGETNIITYTQILLEKHRIDYNMLEFGDNEFVNYDVTTVEINTSSVVCAGNVICDVSSFQLVISAILTTGDKECTISDV